MSIKKAFNKGAGDYDNYRRLLIPCYEDFYRVAVDIIPYGPDRELRALDLGAGTGIYAEQVLKRYPRSHITLVDISPAMLNLAEQRFSAEELARVTIHEADYAKIALKGKFDLIISSLSIHHLSDKGKKELFVKIHNLLEPGGIFINADQVLGENNFAEKLYQHTWLQQVQQRGVDDSILEQALARMREGKMSTLSNQLQWLQDTGFTEISTWYQHFSFVVFSGRKPFPESR